MTLEGFQIKDTNWIALFEWRLRAAVITSITTCAPTVGEESVCRQITHKKRNILHPFMVLTRWYTNTESNNVPESTKTKEQLLEQDFYEEIL